MLRTVALGMSYPVSFFFFFLFKSKTKFLSLISLIHQSSSVGSGENLWAVRIRSLNSSGGPQALIINNMEEMRRKHSNSTSGSVTSGYPTNNLSRHSTVRFSEGAAVQAQLAPMFEYLDTVSGCASEEDIVEVLAPVSEPTMLNLLKPL